MSARPIYLDTNLWNRLRDQHVNATWLLESLATRTASLTLSRQTVHELAKTFVNDPRRGHELFKYVKQYLDAGISVACDVMEQLHLEVEALKTRGSNIDAFYGKAECDSLREVVNNLAKGDFGSEARSSVATGVLFAKSARSGQNSHFDDKPDVKHRLQGVRGDQLEAWMDSEALSERGTAILVRQLLRMYVEGLDESTAIRLAEALLRGPLGLAARSLVRAELYSNWRCAHRDSLPSDLIDDMYHILNANYCQVYATAEAKQPQYATPLLSNRTRVAIYDDRGPIGDWLLGLEP